MTHVVWKVSDEKHELSIFGHAGSGPAGEDIVCAGISAIGYALLGFLQNDGTASGLKSLVDSGSLEVSCRGGERTAAAFEMAYIGLKQIEKQYPQYVDCHIVATGD